VDGPLPRAGPENVGLSTGDATVNRDAPVLCCTAEVLANIALRDGDARTWTTW
jgi:superfamily II RNA helicase